VVIVGHPKRRAQQMFRKLSTVMGLVVGLPVAAALAGTPWGGDAGPGSFIPPDKDVAKCENGLTKAAIKFAGCVSKCDQKRASGKSDVAGESTCEIGDPAKSCLAKYNKTRDKILPGCPPCVDLTKWNDIAAQVEALIDAVFKPQIYCQSSSGAFLDPSF